MASAVVADRIRSYRQAGLFGRDGDLGRSGTQLTGSGHGIDHILFGKANPSGKLPVTFPKQFNDSPAYGNYPGKDLVVTYSEGIYVGYRGFDKSKIEPLFPVGHGLSYTKFEYGNQEVP